MKISAKTEYACIAMIELAARYGSGDPVRIRTIAEQHGVPSRFLVQILLQLKGAGLVASTRGAGGGYELLVPPDEISLGSVMEVIDGPPDAEYAGSASLDSPVVRALAETWREVAQIQHQRLHGLSLAQVLERARRKGENMYYI